MADEIKIVITRQRFEEVFSIDDSFHLAELTLSEAYRYTCQFVMGENGEYLTEAEARALFKGIKRKELSDYVAKFYKAITDAFVNPTNAGS
jgi:hypothetical protein